MTKSRPFVLRAHEVIAILASQQTRITRPIKGVEGKGFVVLGEHGKPPWKVYGKNKQIIQGPFGAPGDLLWCKETWGSPWHHAQPKAFYKATDPDVENYPDFDGWEPAETMPQELSRLTLRVKDVSPQRVQNTTANQALAEGISQTEFWTPEELSGRPFEEKWWDDYHFWLHYPQIPYERFWNAHNTKPSHDWNANPWTFSADVERVE